MTESAITTAPTVQDYKESLAKTPSSHHLAEQGAKLILTAEQECRMTMVQQIQRFLARDDNQMHLAANHWLVFDANHILVKVAPKEFQQAVEEIAFEHLQKQKGFEVMVKHRRGSCSKIALRKQQPQKSRLQKLLGGLSSLFQAEVLV